MHELVLDISKYDEGIDLAEWKKRLGLWGVIIKVGGNEGGRYKDRLFEHHYANAKAAGIHIGFYYYSTVTDVNTAKADAQHMIELVGNKTYDLPWYLDVEDGCQKGNPGLMTSVIEAFCDTLNSCGKYGGVYTFGSMWLSDMYPDRLVKYANWIAWWQKEWPSAAGDIGMWQQGGINIDGDIVYDDLPGFHDCDWCIVDYPKRINGGGTVSKIDLADVAALIHYDMVTDDRNGYSQSPVRWGGDFGGYKTLEINGRKYTYALGSYDCSSSTITAWRLALEGTPYEGCLDAASYTGNMREVFVNSGLFYAEYSTAKRGDLYLNEGVHVAMCQDGGSDGIFGYDCLSEFNHNEWHGATDGEPGDQTGDEAVLREYYDDNWNTVLHYNGAADYNPEPPAPIKPKVPDEPKGSVYRLYNQYDGLHHYTVGHGEAQDLVDSGWTYEGVAWVAPSKGTKIRRLYNRHDRNHLLTTSDTEAIELVGIGWNYEGVPMYSGGKKDVYRMYNQSTGEHMFTTSTTERDTMVKNGWKYEGVAFKAEK